jgi:hypothetical protein
MLRTLAPVICILALSGCSYRYNVKAKVVDGRLMFDANPQWFTDCVRRIEVRADDEPSETLWEQSISHKDACENTFPIAYGQALRGEAFVNDIVEVVDRNGERQSPAPAAKKLQVDIIYAVSTTTGATGYGCGGFCINPNLQVENLGCS